MSEYPANSSLLDRDEFLKYFYRRLGLGSSCPPWFVLKRKQFIECISEGNIFGRILCVNVEVFSEVILIELPEEDSVAISFKIDNIDSGDKFCRILRKMSQSDFERQIYVNLHHVASQCREAHLVWRKNNFQLKEGELVSPIEDPKA